MVCAIHSKTNMIYITFIILYIITIEEVYCDVKDVNDICLSNIKNDLDNCSDADDCAQKLFNTNKDYDKLQLHTQKYALFLYSDMAVGYKDFLVSLNEDCKHNIRAKGYPKTLDDPIFETYQKCVDDNKSFGFWRK
ncbi:Hypothetical protein CINCED_3A001225 [Cinara cedri]|uniref:Uncharacterized protein n=1 Tax=Cinara cedri TaxID=506608 RepID=A0A5E4M5T0_9HEMI|nr:Hypothetical protein CINCED_3A001225 [Cinara cedri]